MSTGSGRLVDVASASQGIPLCHADGTPLTAEERAALRLEMAAAGGLPPERLFDGDPRYSAERDADGIPLFHADGTPLTPEERAALRRQMIVAGGLDPNQLFKGDPRFSAFDEFGIPTHRADGTPLTDEERRRLKLEMARLGGLPPEKYFAGDPRFGSPYRRGTRPAGRAARFRSAPGKRVDRRAFTQASTPTAFQ